MYTRQFSSRLGRWAPEPSYYFGDLVRRMENDPTKVLEQSKKEKKKRKKFKMALDTLMSPLSFIVGKTVDKSAPLTVSDEKRIRALIDKALIEYGLL